jgi:hypothetical protein
MSSEQSIDVKSLHVQTVDIDKKNIPEKIKTKVNINHLLLKLKQKQKLRNKENLLFLTVIGSIVITMGIIYSL